MGLMQLQIQPLTPLVDEFAGRLFGELDYIQEGLNAERFQVSALSLPQPMLYLDACLTLHQLLFPAQSAHGSATAGHGLKVFASSVEVAWDCCPCQRTLPCMDACSAACTACGMDLCGGAVR